MSHVTNRAASPKFHFGKRTSQYDAPGLDMKSPRSRYEKPQTT